MVGCNSRCDSMVHLGTYRKKLWCLNSVVSATQSGCFTSQQLVEAQIMTVSLFMLRLIYAYSYPVLNRCGSNVHSTLVAME
jgi:hypothetical protein